MNITLHTVKSSKNLSIKASVFNSHTYKKTTEKNPRIKIIFDENVEFNKFFNKKKETDVTKNAHIGFLISATSFHNHNMQLYMAG